VGPLDVRSEVAAPRSQVEVDFVVYGESGLYAIEVKNSRSVAGESLRGLKTFVEDYPQCRPYLLYRGRDRLVRDGVLCVPCEEFLLGLKPGEMPG
jgi:predicted AAA+ superfamily ATPase